jgi:hypothetical protein
MLVPRIPLSFRLSLILALSLRTSSMTTCNDSQMRAVITQGIGGPEALKIGLAPIPTLKSRQAC